MKGVPFKIDKDFYKWAKMALRDVHKNEVDEQKEIFRRTTRKKVELLQRLDGRITTERYDILKETWDSERKSILEELKRVSDDKSLYYEAGFFNPRTSRTC